MLNVVIPMAGEGSRFLKAGYIKPKPFIDVDGIPMITRVLENLSYPNARYILIVRKDHMEKEAIFVKKIKEEHNVNFIPIDKLTEGAACTILYARKYINNDEPLLIANSDQIIDINIAEFIDDCNERNLDGSILTFIDRYKDPKWSFAKIDKNNLVCEVKEKTVISEYATAGVYFFKRGKHLINATLDMIAQIGRAHV